MAKLSGYFNQTNGILYSYLFCLPLLLLYELLILISQPDTSYLVRISVDVWMKSFFSFFGLNPVSATLYAAAAIGAIIVFRKRHQLKNVKGRYFGYMLGESVVYAILISMSIGLFLGSFLNIAADSGLAGLSRLQLIALSLGAGLYEELFFRVILVSLLIYFFSKIFRAKNTAYVVSAVIAALIFSYVHYVGDFADTFTLSSFLFRFLFGLALNVIYVVRGFGMAAWTHATYDLIVVTTM
ncbi:MAG: CPBP family intramembrane metalloprotease [Balneolaceae bacterium]|nr:CPBP family intramembrane metalloprotease [Balneolaceae bacterium]MCH8548679.1 CPBP family intramembrane metalloprotease [Balneolaceae bacterium]